MSIIACFGKVTNPLLWFIVTLLLNSEIPNSQATSGKKWDVKLHRDRWFLPQLVTFSRSCVNDSRQNVLLITLELLNSPHYCGFIRFILSFTSSGRENLDISWVAWNWNFDNDVVTHVRMFIYCSNFDWIFYSVVFTEFLNDRGNFKRQIDILGNSVSHYLEYTIWRNEGNWSISVESCEFHTLMEFNIVDLNTFLLSLFGIDSLSITWLSDQKFIVNSKFTLRHSWKLCLYNNLPDHIRLQNSTSIWD